MVIATYALCGFSNLASMGLMLGALGGMAPSRRSDISGLMLRAMIAGNVACFMTACIAGKSGFAMISNFWYFTLAKITGNKVCNQLQLFSLDPFLK